MSSAPPPSRGRRPRVPGRFLALVHAIGGRLRFLDVIPRSTWLSLAGGISAAYVFFHLLPELAAGQRALGGPLEHH
jgi:hypothetical protein